MSEGKFQAVKKVVLDYLEEIENCKPEDCSKVLSKYMSEDFKWEGVYPFMEQVGADAVADVFWRPLKESLVNLQIRKDVFFAGTNRMDGKTWVMNMGQFMGLFDKEYMNVPRTCKMHHMRYGEWICVENGKITEISMHVDLVGFMQMAGINPLLESTGYFFVYPGPRDHNGLLFEDAPYDQAAKTEAIIDLMMGGLESLNKSNNTPQDMLRLTWTEDMIWYGPSGIGASYTIPRYQKQHQIPFRTQLTDKVANDYTIFFAEGDFACYVMSMDVTPTGGWIGMTGGHKSAFLRGDTDVYYCKNGKISENWCFIDLPYWLKEQGIDILERATSLANPKI